MIYSAQLKSPNMGKKGKFLRSKKLDIEVTYSKWTLSKEIKLVVSIQIVFSCFNLEIVK